MGWLRRAFERKVTDFTELIDLTAATATGISISESSSLRLGAVWACVRVISEDVASLPLFVYERLDRGKRRAMEHPLHELLHDQPNPEMTALQFRETLTAHVLTWGNGYAFISTDTRGIPRALWPLLPDRTTIKRDPRSRRLFYETEAHDSDERITLEPDQVLHLAGLGLNGLYGYSPIGLHRQAIALGLAAEEFGARFFGQGGHFGGFIEVPGTLGDQPFARLKRELNETYAGLREAHRWRILEGGGKATHLTVPPDEAQYIESRKFSVTEIARIFRVPPHKIGDLERATFSNIEESSIDYVVSTLRPWLVRWEQAIRKSLLSREDRQRFFAEHLVDGLLRGNLQQRYAAYATARQWGWMNADDILELENRNPLPDGQGQRYLEPANMRTPEEAADAALPVPPKEAANV